MKAVDVSSIRAPRGTAALVAVSLAWGLGVAEAQRPAVTTVTIDNQNNANTPILDFDPVADPDRQFISASKGRAPTVFNAALKANTNATVDEARVMPLILNEERIGYAAQGSMTKNAPTFGNWQYIDKMVTWGGTAQRNVTAPGQAWIDAAHRNGVKIYGNVFFAPTAFGGQIGQVDYFVQTDSEGNRPIAQKLIDIAETQGFDGWFINQETDGGDGQLAEQVALTMEYIQENSDIEVVWYDAMTESGAVVWQDALNTSNDRFFSKQNGKVVSNAMFLDFTASPSEQQSSAAHAESRFRSPYDVYAGVTLETSGIDQGDNSMEDIMENGHVSQGLFRSDKERWDAFRDNNGWDIQDFIRSEEQLYVGQAGDPSDTSQNVVAWNESTDAYSQSTNWKGFANYIAAKTPLVRDRFVTNFNYGVGYDYFVGGELLNTRSWNNMGAQDVLPTWRWMVETDDATPVDVNFDFSDAYIGGSSVRIEGSLDAQTDVPLYLASMDVFDDSKLTLTYKTGEVGASEMQVYVELEGQEGTRIALPVGSAASADWNEIELDLSAYAGEKIAAIGLRLLDADDAGFGVSIGQLGVIRGERDVVAPATGVDFQSLSLAGETAELRMTWDHSDDYSRDFAENNVYYYNVYQELEDASRVFLGVTGGEGLYVDQVNRDGDELTSTLVVEAVSLEFGVSPSESISLFWEADLNVDGVLSQADIDRFALNWRADTSALSYTERVMRGDMNADGVTDWDDWFLVRESFQSNGVAFTAPTLIVPEPTAAALVLAGLLAEGIAAVGPRRRRR